MVEFWELISTREREILLLLTDGAADKQIARQLHLSLNTVKWHNRQIYAKLGVENRIQAVAKATELNLLGEEQSPAKPMSQIPHNLPAPVSSFVGREKEIAKIQELLQSHRLVTLTGPGGVGKTRLALEVARELLQPEGYPNGIYFIEFAIIANPELVGEVICDGLHLQPPAGEPLQEVLERYLSDRKQLMVLDNFEHLLAAAPLVSELLAAAPDLQVLCTSREALHLQGEQCFGVEPLGIHPSRELFLQRTREVNPCLDLTEEDLAVVDQICARLDNLPLAVELAAARTSLFSIEALLESLENRFRVLTAAPRDAPQRHRTLWDGIDWSCNLLTSEEQILFRRLAVFQGGRSLDAVEAVCCFDLDLDVLDGIASLLNKNLIRQEVGPEGEPRFYLLETIHKFIWEKLKESGEDQDIQLLHAQYFVGLAEEAKFPTRGGQDQIRWLNRLKVDHNNLRVAFEKSLEMDHPDLALRMVGCLEYYWIRRGSFEEAVQWVSWSMDNVDSVSADIQAGVYLTAGFIYYIVCGEYELGRRMCQKALDLFTDLEDIREMGWSHIGLLGISEMFPQERELALENFNQALRYLGEVDDQVGIAQAWNSLGIHEQLSSHFDAARAAHQHALEIARRVGDPIRERLELNNLGGIDHFTGNVLSARRFYLESLRVVMHAGLDLVFSAADLCIDIASAEFDLGRPNRGVILLSAGDALYKAGAFHPQTTQLKYINELYEFSRTQLAEDEYQQAWAEGQSMTPQEAVAFALEEPD